MDGESTSDGPKRPDEAARATDFEALLRENARVMAAAVRRVCGRRHAALVPDVEQEIRLALWKRLGGGDAVRHPVSYVYKVALTTALAHLRRAERERPAGGERAEEMGELPGRGEPAGGPGDLEPAERRRLIEEVLADLEPDPEKALRSWLAGFNHLEIAALHGWSESRARHLVYRTLERLRRAAGSVESAEEETP